MLKTTPEALEAFEQSYHIGLLNQPVSDNFFEVNAKQAAGMTDHITVDDADVESMIDRIVKELLAETSFYSYKKGNVRFGGYDVRNSDAPVTRKEIMALPEELRPQLTGHLMKVDTSGDSSPLILYMYKTYLEEKNPIRKKNLYGSFRQGLDIQDLDPILYRILEKNRNSMGNWFPQLVNAASKHDFFKLPDTTIVKVPLTLLQMARLDYFSLTKTTLEIADRFCEQAFNLDREKEYFVKTGVYSSKFDFRNAYIHEQEEVRTIGEYLLFLHFQASCHAHFDLSGRNQPVMYGMGTTVEWVCREFIQDNENNPCIYKGLPLHTEYRVFIDCDRKKILGISPYWRGDVMKQRFGHENDKDSPHQVHDYIIYTAHENTLMKRYEDNKGKVLGHVKELLPDLRLTGQWSLDVMQNGDDFYLIDMALAENSALNDCIPAGELKLGTVEDWLPDLSK